MSTLEVDTIDTKTGTNSLTIKQNDTTAITVDTSQHVLVGKTSVSYTTVGHEFKTEGRAFHTADGAKSMSLVRKTSDGPISDFYKDGSEVGNIGVWNSDNISLYGNSSHAGIGMATNSVEPVRNNAPIDDTLDLGVGSARWDDVYATNGTIQTSDQNEKQSIQALTSTEIAVAKRISKLFKTFKWNSAVEEKGDNARTHIGVIAQDVQQAFTDEGLNASNYALFISSTWWENEEGNTKEEATEGYTQRTRLGIRYPELLSFVSSAFEQRLTNIETRLTTLENA